MTLIWVLMLLGLRRTSYRIILADHELDTLQQRFQIGTGKRRVRYIDDLCVAVGVDHEYPGLRKRSIGLLCGTGLGNVKAELPHLIHGQVISDWEVPAAFLNLGLGFFLGVGEIAATPIFAV